VYASTAPPLPPPSAAITALTGTAPAALAAAKAQLPAGSTVGGWIRAQLAGTPGRLRMAALGCVLLGLLLGAAGFSALQTKASGLDQARRDLDLLVTVQTAYTALAEADSRATNLFLAGGLEDPEGRRLYLDRLDLAGRALSRASSAAPDLRSRTDLQAAHVALTRYAGLVEAARANNRQGYPIGVAYLKQASALLRTDVLPTLTRVQVHEESAVTDALSRGQGWLLAVVGGAVLVLLGLAQLWLFRLSRRVVNLPLAGATALGLVTLLAAASALGSAATSSDFARRTQFADVLGVADARLAAFDAKSNESLTLIARGNGDRYEQAYADLVARAYTALASAGPGSTTTGLAPALTAWTDVHTRIRAADDDGRWDAAVSLATRTADDGSNAAFDRFDRLSQSALIGATGTLDRALERPLAGLRFQALLLLVTGLLVAAAGWAGVSRRLREFR
jgi:hypothetical protein